MRDEWIPDDMDGQCFAVPMSGGQSILVRATEPPGQADAEALARAVAEIRRHWPKPPPEAVDLYARLDAARTARGLRWRELAGEADVGAPVLSRLANGILPTAEERERLETWLLNNMPTTGEG